MNELSGQLLKKLLENVVCLESTGPVWDNLVISGITDDSRQVRSGYLFVAVRGAVTDGHDFVEAALKAGAQAIIVESKYNLENFTGTAAFIVVENSRQVLGEVAARFYGNPGEELSLIGITGTNGKTTISYLLEHALSSLGERVGVIGTVDYRFRTAEGRCVRYPALFTTPDPVRLQGVLREMADSGVTRVIMEVSSHALHQQRLGALLFDLAVFTNLSQDHLDYHHTLDEYFSAKCLLFTNHLRSAASVVVVSEDDPKTGGWAGKIAKLCRENCLETIRCGSSPDNDYSFQSYQDDTSGLSCEIIGPSGNRYAVTSPLMGRFNLDNLLASFSALAVLGVPEDRIADLLETAEGAPGRMERVQLAEKPAGQPTVLVDYAHTPDALAKALQALATVPHRNTFCVVGCGGDRDRSKRAYMGAIAAAEAQVVIVTDDNPRSEEPADIRAAIISGIKQAGKGVKPADWLRTRSTSEEGCVEIADRSEAIAAAVAGAGRNDIVLIAGKGHEKYQITAAGKRFFDDCLAAQQSSLNWDLQTLAAACKGSLIKRTDDCPLSFPAVSTDSRKLENGAVFVALKGDRFDAHDFLASAVKSGAGCLIVSDSEKAEQLPVTSIRVADTMEALGRLARWRRQAVKAMQSPVVVGITGSCGKTTVKEMTAAIFNKRWPERVDKPPERVVKTAGNFNNLVGLPLTLLPVSAQHRGVVLEMGMNSAGEIARLTEIADPDIACITNIHAVHLEGLGTIEGVAAAKKELFANSGNHSVHIINLDDELVASSRENHGQSTIGFAVTEKGLARQPEVWADEITVDLSGKMSMQLHVRDRSRHVNIPAPGIHNSVNGCAAAAIALAAGIDLKTIAAGLEAFRPAPLRMQIETTPGGLNLLNDSYNANPASMVSALDTLANLATGTRMALLGEMLELGEVSGELHRELGMKAAQSGLNYLGYIGKFGEDVAEGALAGGLSQKQIVILEDKEKAVEWIAELMHSGRLQPGDWCLIKASRGIALDAVVEQLLNNQRT